MAFYHPILFRLDAERAHTLTIAALGAWGKAGTPLAPSVPRLATTVAGIAFPNPIGLAAGVDKDGRAIDGFFGLGFGSIEIGTLTPLAQPGNPKPRIFRLPEDRAVINRLGFNNGGLNGALPRAQSAKRNGVLGINVGANKDATDRTADYVHGVTRAARHADYITINISSPNTPGLRDLQHGAALRDLLAACTAAKGTTPIFLKVAPDLEPADIDDIARAAIDNRIDALIVNNTTISRPGLRSANAKETGGLSGAPLVPLARQRLSDFRKATGAAIPLISVGGVGSGTEAYARLRAGASLVQLYTALVYEGPGLPARILRELDALLTLDGFATVADAVGTDT
ncbi:quinone-dependent dihydroorotate dehydrogenase [Sphingomonas sp. CFBP 13728]|uniref:quinone-dependent dihydroorotate dehydrogenase n=1 Tax=Sphingomonas sp. CFBP 13728 TaxID=2775294 RepID=UPI0017858690|nr:quinone-dependent dihydroorotate dehydrogenase [Sphingomonas sp. CFBP 13728]MBD8620230.1 quinone-dependent dihydroorotate dehydrogenase [Sphingomonas sp. CFBP 13728]